VIAAPPSLPAGDQVTVADCPDTAADTEPGAPGYYAAA
jgi:hypothetical protein